MNVSVSIESASAPHLHSNPHNIGNVWIALVYFVQVEWRHYEIPYNRKNVSTHFVIVVISLFGLGTYLSYIYGDKCLPAPLSIANCSPMDVGTAHKINSSNISSVGIYVIHKIYNYYGYHQYPAQPNTQTDQTESERKT